MHNESQKPEQCEGQGRASMMKTAACIVLILTSLKLHLAMLKYSMSVNQPYYMANSVSRQDEPNPALWPAVHVLFWSRTPDNKSGFRCHHLWCLTSRGLVQRLVAVGGSGSPSPGPFFPVNAYSLGKYFLTPILHNYQVQIVRPKYASDLTGYPSGQDSANLHTWGYISPFSCSLFHIINPLFTKLVQSRWLDCSVYWPGLCLGP